MSRPSNLDLLRARYAELESRGEQTFHKAVGHGVSDGPKGSVGLLVEYREPDWEKAREIDKKWVTSTESKADLYAGCELLATCCVDIWLRDDENGQEVKNVKGLWTPGLALGAGPVNFARAAKELGRGDGQDGIESVAAVLVNDWEIEEHKLLLAAWTPAPPEVGEDFVGESQPVATA